MSDQDRVDLLGSLYSIVNDLWGSAAQTAQSVAPGALGNKPAAQAEGAQEDGAQSKTPAPSAHTVRLGRFEKPAAAPAAEPAPEPAVPAVPPITEYWRTSDEPLPWTEALVQPLPRDGLTSVDTWRFCHELAEEVLAGDAAAYGRVLEKVQPLADLAPYTGELKVKIDSADTLSVDFTLTPELAAREPITHLCCTAIRIARDLLAALPAAQVKLQGQAGAAKLDVTLSREALRGIRWGFVDAEALIVDLGGQIAH